jgi:hypothetical protein
MSQMLSLVEEMHVRLNEISASEQTLLRTLRDALNRVDDKLMQDVRTMTAEHETRRSGVLSELQSFAARIGAFPVPRKSALELAHEQNGAWLEGVVEESPPRSMTRDSQGQPNNAGNITADLEHYFRAGTSRRN